MKNIKIAIVGLGNCASSLVQGIAYYQNKQQLETLEASGIMSWDIGGYKPSDIEIAAAFDIDARKVGRDVAEAIFALPNCTTVFCKDVPATGVKVSMGNILDGFSKHLENYPVDLRFCKSTQEELKQQQVIEILRESEADVLVNYLPVGSEQATKFYAQCALEAGVAFINNIPVFIASDPEWAAKFAEKNLPIIGDDIKSQVGATIVHRVLTELFSKRGAKIERSYQLNTGGNTDFLNMLNYDRLKSKKKSKTEAVQSLLDEKRLEPENIHIGPSDWVSWQKDNKICFIRMEAKIFGDVPINLELRLSVEDSPNSAGVVIDAIRYCKLALDRGQGGVLYEPSAYFMKHPPEQYPDSEAHKLTEKFRMGEREV